MDEIDPAFLVEAEKLLQEGKSREAAVLCTRGLANYPEYYTAYAVLIRALDAMGDFVQMQEVYDSAPNVIKLNVKHERLATSPVETTQPEPEINEPVSEIETVETYGEEIETELDDEEDLEITKETEEILEQAIEVETVEDDDETDTVVETEVIEIIEADIEEPLDDDSEEIELEVEEIDEQEIEGLEDVEEISPDLEKDIHRAIRNDELSPEVVSDLTRNERVEQEEIDIKETLTLAKIYEQQDAFAESLIIYKQLQEITADKSKYADKILELQTLVDQEKK